MAGLSASAGGQSRQVNVGGDNYGPIIFGGDPAPAPSLHQLPPAILDFSGRVGDVAEIERMASSSPGGPCIINIFGSPGIGKSALTIHVAHRLAEHLDQVQLYAELGEIDGQAPTSAQILQQFVAALAPATAGIPVGAQELPARYRSLLSGRRCLVVLDNAQSAEQITDLIPSSAPSVILVTSRASLTAVPAIVPYRLGLMSPAESLELLSHVSRRTWPDGQPPSAGHMLIRQCGRLPLALRIVGAILKKKPHWTLEKVAADLAEEQTRLAKLTEGPLDVRSCFEVSYRHLAGNEAEAFRLLSLLPLALFTLRHAASFLQRPEGDAEQVVETLVDAQLLETDDGRYFKFHDLLLLYARERSRAAGDDPDGARATLFLNELTDEFAAAYTRRLRENSWTGPRPGGSGWSPVWELGERFRAAPDDLYIPTRLAPADQPERAESWRAVLTKHRRVLVLGTGGAGKTILADRICYEIAAAQDGAAQPRSLGFAVPLRLRGDHGQQPLAALIADAIRSRYRLDPPAEALARMLSGWRTVVIFDGLDELPSPIRDSVTRDISEFCSAYPSVQVIVTSRPGPATSAFATMEFSRYEIASFTEADSAAYIERWSRVTRAAPGAYKELLTGIRRDWLATPLLMAQLVVGYDQTGFVPQREIDLYDMTYSLLFQKRDLIRGIRRTAFTPQMTGWLVAYLAYELKARARMPGIPDSEFRYLLTAFEPFYPVINLDVSQLADDLAALDLPVRRIPDETAGEPRWLVTRDSFSEYLAARWIIGSSSFEELASRLMTVIEASDFIAGGMFVAQLAARQGPDHEQEIARYLRDVLDNHSAPQPEHTRAAIAQILASLA